MGIALRAAIFYKSLKREMAWLMRLHSDSRICLTENQNKEKTPILKTASPGTFSCNASSEQEF